MPVPKSIEKLEHLGIEAIRAKRFGSINDETNHYFVTASLCRHRSMSVADAVSEYEAGRLEAEEIINKCQLNLNQIAFALYGIEGDDRLSLQRSAAEIKTGDDIVDSNESEDRSSIALPQSIRHAQELISYMVGCVMGRWDIRFTTGEKDCTSLPGPFEPLPVRSPGMLHVGVETSLDKSFKSYPLETAISGLLPDDPDHLKDLTLRIRDALEFVWNDRTAVVEKELSEILGVDNLREYFRKPGPGGFWDCHIKRYSKSRRKAPIYWLLQSSKKNYALWLYYHRLDKDMLFKALVNYVEPKIRLEEEKLKALLSQAQSAGNSGKESKRLAKEAEKQEDFLSELRDFEDKLRRAANLHLDPDLNDGVVLNIAPLWELVPWKEAKKYWDELMEGQYEWSSIGKQLREKGLVK